jgi:hypothetical protein
VRARRGRRRAFDPLYLCTQDETHAARNTTPPSTSSRKAVERVHGSDSVEAGKMEICYFRTLEAATLATPPGNTCHVCSTEPFFLNKSATKDKSCSKVQRYHGVTTEAAAATNNDMQ